jgi:uncharacterized protein (DUF2267 family)
MTTANTQHTLDEALAAARQLSPEDRARLAAHLPPELAAALEDPRSGSITAGPWDLFMALVQVFREDGPDAPSITEELLASRR